MELTFDLSQDELPLFLAEADEHLQVLDENLVQLERTADDVELLQSLFRAAHTLKGMSGMIGHRRMTELTHALEAALDSLRKKSISISTELVDLCLDAVDGLRLLREEVVTGQEAEVEVANLVAQFQAITGASGATPSTQPTPAPVITPLATPTNGGNGKDAAKSTAALRRACVTATIERSSIAPAARAFQILLALQEAGAVENMRPTQEQIERSEAVHEVSAEVLTAQSDEQILLALGQISEVGNLRVNGAKEAPEGTQVRPDPLPSNGNGNSGKKDHQRADMTVRTTVERLDNLMNLVGELITDRNHLYLIRNRMQLDTHEQADVLAERVGHLGRITDQLQEEVMRIRMLPIGNIFNKFPRMIRDMAQKTGKQIDLVIHGEDTELDRSMIEEINDPLIHLIRNSADHGIETPQERLAAGKPERGTVTLTARHEQGRILLTVEDDGRGIDPEKVRKSAVQKGLISEEEAAALSEEQAIDLVFLPGLSTAQKVTDISGRGVGLDIVHNNIQRVNGSIQLESHLGRGCVFQITLPLTLAIVPTLLVAVEEEIFAIPLVMVSETLRLSRAEIKTVRGKPVTLVRGSILPLVYLADIFDLPRADDEDRLLYAVVVHSGKQRVGLIVDVLTGQEEVVVKSLGSLVGNLPGISSAAILGDGKITLIVDIPGVFKLAGIH
jgi:two-component system chemotaxis sensor kinase CheA